MRHGFPLDYRGLAAVAALAAGLAAAPADARSWSDFIASFGPAETPSGVLDYLKTHPLVLAAPKPQFVEIHTETVDGVVAQTFTLAGFESGIGRLEGVREERRQGTVRSGAQTISMETALAGLVLVSMQNKTTSTSVFLRKIELSGDFFPPKTDRSIKMAYERIQLAKESVVEEMRECVLTWTAQAGDDFALTSRCTGATKVSQPNRDGSVMTTGSVDNPVSSHLLRSELGWIFDVKTRVLDFKRAKP
jgi:hypothetical protein